MLGWEYCGTLPSERLRGRFSGIITHKGCTWWYWGEGGAEREDIPVFSLELEDFGFTLFCVLEQC